MKRYLKNNGVPVSITVFQQKVLEFYDINGVRQKIEIVMYRDADGEKQDPRIKKFGVAEDEKAIIYYENGKFKTRTIKQAGLSFTVRSYPHIIDFRTGTSSYDERSYTIKVGEIVEVENETDFQILWDRFGFLDEVNSKGEIVKENKHTHISESKLDLNRLPPRYDEVSSSFAPRQTPKSERITEIVENKELEIE